MRPYQRRNEEEIQERKRTAYQLHKLGVERRYIAERLGIRPTYVNELIKAYERGNPEPTSGGKRNRQKA